MLQAFTETLSACSLLHLDPGTYINVLVRAKNYPEHFKYCRMLRCSVGYVVPNVWKDHCTLIFRVKQSTLLELMYPEDEGSSEQLVTTCHIV